MLTATLVLLVVLAPQSTPDTTPPIAGPWRAVLESQGGELPFGLDIEERNGQYTAMLINGPEQIPVPHVKWADGTLTIRIEPYESVITCKPTEGGRVLEGSWIKMSGERRTSLAFRATKGGDPRFKPVDATASTMVGTADGRWAVHFGNSQQVSVGIFKVHHDGTATGTFLTTTGDYRYLAGDFIEGQLRLSCFDGSHAFLFKARMLDEDTIQGDFWSSGGRPQPWKARRDATVTLPEAFDLTKWNEGVNLGDLAYPDLEGNLRSLDDPAFAGKARMLVVFGTWCPNCNDEAPYLVELDARYRQRGLSILGLAFEHSGEFERDAERVRRFAERHSARYPILIAGLSNKGAASEAFPALDRVRSFPTTIFMDAKGVVRAVHQGYTGPATGEAHLELRRKYEGLIEELLAEGSH